MYPHCNKICNSFFFKFNQSHKIGWSCMGSAGISYLPLFKKLTPLLLSSPLFLCVHVFFPPSYMALPGHLQCIPKQTSSPLKFSVQILWLPPHLVSKCLVIVQLDHKFLTDEMQCTKSTFYGLSKLLASWKEKKNDLTSLIMVTSNNYLFEMYYFSAQLLKWNVTPCKVSFSLLKCYVIYILDIFATQYN